MKRMVLHPVIFSLMVSFIFLQGCAADKQYVKNDAALLTPLKCVRYETPGIIRSTMAETFFLTSAAVALPGGSALILLSDEYAKSRGEAMQMKIPDFGNLVMSRFVEKMAQDAAWPSLTAEAAPLKEEPAESCTLIEFKVKRLAYGYLDIVRGGGNGFLSKTMVTMKDSQGEVLWQKSFTYVSKDFERDKGIDEFEADDGKLLREEIEFAADKTAADFIQHLKNGNM